MGEVWRNDTVGEVAVKRLFGDSITEATAGVSEGGNLMAKLQEMEQAAIWFRWCFAAGIKSY